MYLFFFSPQKSAGNKADGKSLVKGNILQMDLPSWPSLRIRTIKEDIRDGCSSFYFLTSQYEYYIPSYQSVSYTVHAHLLSETDTMIPTLLHLQHFQKGKVFWFDKKDKKRNQLFTFCSTDEASKKRRIGSRAEEMPFGCSKSFPSMIFFSLLAIKGLSFGLGRRKRRNTVYENH